MMPYCMIFKPGYADRSTVSIASRARGRRAAFMFHLFLYMRHTRRRALVSRHEIHSPPSCNAPATSVSVSTIARSAAPQYIHDASSTSSRIVGTAQARLRIEYVQSARDGGSYFQGVAYQPARGEDAIANILGRSTDRQLFSAPYITRPEAWDWTVFVGLVDRQSRLQLNISESLRPH